MPKKEPNITAIYDPKGKELETLKHVYDRYYEMKDNPQRESAVKEWEESEKQWDMFKEEGNLEDWQADYYTPLTLSIVESVLAEMVDQAPRPIILPRSSEDKPKSTVMRHIFDYTWDVADGDMQLYNVLKDSLIYGQGFAQEFYWKDRRMIQKLIDVNKTEKGSKKKYEEVETFDYDDCYMESVSPYDLFFDEKAQEINRGPNKARDCIRRYVMNIDDFRIIFAGDVWDPMDRAKLVKAGGDTNYYRFYKPPEKMDKSKEVEILWYWSRMPEDRLNIVANDVAVVMGPNFYKHKQLPFAKADDVRRPHQFYHKGEPTILKYIQKENNTMRRMLTDRNHLDIDKMWLVGRNETFSEDDVIARPHGVIRVDDPSQYKPMEYRDVPRSFEYSLESLHKDAVRASGVDDRFQSNRVATTATEAAIMKESTLRRIRMKLRLVEKGFLVDIGRMRVANIIQFYSQPKLERVLGEEGTKEFKKTIDMAQKNDRLVMQEGVPYEAKYRDIRVKDKEITFDERGQTIEKPASGFTFFEAKPETYIPMARGGFDIRFEAGASMPISEPLMQSKVMDMVTVLMPLATGGIGYDPVKLADELLKVMKFDPADFKIEDEQKDLTESRIELQVDLASQENELVTRGQPIPPLGTPYADANHSKIHIAYLKSEQLQPQTKPFELLYKHVMGEIMAMSMRGEGTGLEGEQNISASNTPQAGPSASQPVNQELKDIVPAKIQGGEELQGTQKGSVMTNVLRMLRRNK